MAEDEPRPNPYIAFYEQKLGQLSLLPPNSIIELKNPDEPEQGWKMSLADGVPIPDIPPVPLPESDWWGD